MNLILVVEIVLFLFELVEFSLIAFVNLVVKCSCV